MPCEVVEGLDFHFDFTSDLDLTGTLDEAREWLEEFQSVVVLHFPRLNTIRLHFTRNPTYQGNDYDSPPPDEERSIYDEHGYSLPIFGPETRQEAASRTLMDWLHRKSMTRVDIHSGSRLNFWHDDMQICAPKQEGRMLQRDMPENQCQYHQWWSWQADGVKRKGFQCEAIACYWETIGSSDDEG